MKLSTRIKKYVDPSLLNRPIRLMVDGGAKEDVSTISMDIADAYHSDFLQRGYKLLPKECPVVSTEIIMHYTSTTYREWRG